MVNYWNAWTASTHDLFHRVKSGEIGPVQKIIVQYGHQGPKEIGVSKEFADWLYDPVKNGGGAIMDFGCYGAEWALWLKGRPTRGYATTCKSWKSWMPPANPPVSGGRWSCAERDE